MDIFTSISDSVRIDVEPKRVEHTSAETFNDLLNTFIKRYPKAIEEVERIAIDASPFILLDCPLFKIAIAAIIVIGRTISMSFIRPITAASEIAPNPTCERPSPIKEYLLLTNMTPRIAEENEIRRATIIAFLTNGYSMYVNIVFIDLSILFLSCCFLFL